MLRGYRIKKRSMPAYDKIIVPELTGCRSIPNDQPPTESKNKSPMKKALRAASCMTLAFVLIGLLAANNITGTKNTFTLTAYAASDTGSSGIDNGFKLGLKGLDMTTSITMQKNTNTPLPVIKIYQVKDVDGNDYNIDTDPWSNAFEDFNFVEESARVIYSSVFQFSGSNINSITMTSQKGRFIAYDRSAVNAIHQKYPDVIIHGHNMRSDEQYSQSDKELLNTLIKRGQSVTFPPEGISAFWAYTIDDNAKASDTITLTIRYNNGMTQESIVSITEDDNGVITALMH